MDNENNTQQQQNVEANPNNGANEQNQTPANQGNTTTQPQVENNEGKKYSQKEYDDVAAKARGTAERETKKKLLAELGLRPDEEEKLELFKTAYENSKTDEQKRDEEFQNLQARNVELEYDLEEKDYTIKALIELTGKNEEDVDDIVKMSKGLKTEDNTIEDCIKKVISMVKPKIDTPNPIEGVNVEKPIEQNPNIPIGNNIQQPSIVSVDTTENPFKPGPTNNLTKQGELLRTNPELAKKLAKEAGVPLNI